MHDETFTAMGTDVRLLISEDDGLPDAAEVAARARQWIERYEACLSRFRPDSELCALNADPRSRVPASSMLRTAILAALRAAKLTGGLVDPTLGTAIVRAGYATSRAGVAAEPLARALEAAPPRRPARPDPGYRWTQVTVDADAITRPPGVVIDTGGTGKGLAADALAHRLRERESFVVDCGGDIRIGGRSEVVVDHPLGGEPAHVLPVTDGAVATSGLGSRLWRLPDGRYAHHLLDPATGEPAWTGLIAATALAPTALEAESLAKQALLGGPRTARRVLAARGGVIVHDAGDVEVLGPARPRPHLRLVLPARAA